MGEQRGTPKPSNYIISDIYFNSLGQICIPTSGLSASFHVFWPSLIFIQAKVNCPANRRQEWTSNFIGRWVQTPEAQVRCIIVPNDVKIRQSMRSCNFFIFQDGSCCHLGFLKSLTSVGRCGSEGRDASLCQLLSKLVKWFLRYHNFLIFKMMAAAMLESVVSPDQRMAM